MTASGFRRTAFGSRLLRHARRDRARRETGSPESSVSPMFDDWREGVHERIRRQTADLVAARGIRLHSHIRAVNSSMAFAFNLFMPFREYGAAALEKLLSRALPFPVRGRAGRLVARLGNVHARALHAPNHCDQPMSGLVFRRGLSGGLFRDLLDGPCATVRRACLAAELDARLRPDAISFYSHGRSLARIEGRRRRPAKLSVHRKYLADDRIGDYVGGQDREYRTFDVDAAFAEVYASQVHSLVERARGHVGSEETVELRLLECNDGPAPVCCFDRQVQMPGTRRTLDLMGLISGPVAALVAIEVKRYPDNRIQDVPRQLHEYLEIFDPAREGLAADVARSYRKVCRQLRDLGLAAPDPDLVTAGMPVKGLVIVSGYNPRSRLLPRAHELAAQLERPIHLWQPDGDDHRIPEAERWERMGGR